MQRLVEQLLLLARADEGAVARRHRDVDLDDLVLAEAARVRRHGLAVDTPASARGGSAATGGARAGRPQPRRQRRPARPQPHRRRRCVGPTTAGRAGRRRRRARRARGPARARLRALRPARRGPGSRRGRQRAGARDRRGDGPRARRDGPASSPSAAGWGAVRRTPPAADCLNEPSGGFRIGFSDRRRTVVVVQTTSRPRKATPMNTSKLRSKRILIPTAAAVAALVVGGVDLGRHRLGRRRVGRRA